MNNKEYIVLKYNEFLNDFPEKRKFYQIKSIYNFLVHIDEIKNEIDKCRVIGLINEYLDYIIHNSIETKDECKDLYFKFIHPLGILYTKYARFTFLIHYQSALIVLGLINVMFFILNMKLFLMLLFNALGICIVLYLFKKSKATRVYGINW